MKKKILKIQIGTAYDKDTKKNLPVYQTAWAQPDGTYKIIQKVYVEEREVKEKTSNSGTLEA